MNLRDELLSLELALAQRRPGALPGGYEGVLHPAFREIGASGRWWDRATTLEMLRDADESSVAIEAFAIEELAPGLILATYDTAGERPARRSSIWVMDAGRWQVRFHQGTLR
jgi:ribonuclease HI